MQCVVCVKLVLEVIQCYPCGAEARISTKTEESDSSHFLKAPLQKGWTWPFRQWETTLCPLPTGWAQLEPCRTLHVKDIQGSSLRSRCEHPHLVCLLRRKSPGREKNTAQRGASATSQSIVSLPGSPGHQIGGVGYHR